MNYLNILSRVLFRKNSLPIYFILFLTNKCNARCHHCFYWKNINKESEELKLEEIIEISRNIKGIEHLAITGGEPFLRQDLVSVVEAFYKNSGVRSISLQSNGFMTEKIFTAVKDILEKCPKLNLQVAISMDNIGDKHDRMRRVPGIFMRAAETIKKMKTLKRKNLQVAVNIALSSQNQDDIENIYLHIRDIIKPDAIYPLLCRGDVENKELKNVVPGYYEKLTEMCRDDMAKRKIGYKNFLFFSWLNARDSLARKLVLERISNKKSACVNCVAGDLAGVMRENGDVYACELKNLKLGNIREAGYRLEKIWSSPEAARARKWIKQNKCSCTHECFFNFNLLFDFKMAPRIFKEWLKLF